MIYFAEKKITFALLISINNLCIIIFEFTLGFYEYDHDQKSQ